LCRERKFPVSFWNYCTLEQIGPDAVKDWVDAGITVAQTQGFRPGKDRVEDMRAVLDACGEAGLKAIVSDGRCRFGWDPDSREEEEAFRRRFESALKDFGDHPAVFGFHAGDEPHGKKSSLSAFRTYALQKEMAPHLTPFQNLGPYGPGTTEWVGYDDYDRFMEDYITIAHPEFICFDVYWQMEPEEDGRERYFDCLRTFSKHARRHDIPLWVTLLAVGHFRYRCPNEDAFRWQVNTAVAHGFTGIAWFFMYMREPHGNYRVPPIDEHWERTETFEWMSRVNRTFLGRHGPVVTGLKLQSVYHVDTVYGGFESFRGSRLVRKIRDPFPLIISEYKDTEGRDYVGITNNTLDRSQHVVVSFVGRPKLTRIAWHGAEVVETLHPGDDAHPDDARIGPWLAPGQLELWRVEKAAPEGAKPK
jgi:hypothetical protein